MARYYYNKKGELTGVSKSSKDLAQESAIAFAFIAVAICLAPLYPVFFMAYKGYKYMIMAGVHPLFGALASVVAACIFFLMLAVSKFVRTSYLLVVTFVGAYLAFFQGSDAVWGGLFSIVVCVIGFFMTAWASKFNFSSSDEDVKTKQQVFEKVSFQPPRPRRKRKDSVAEMDAFSFLEMNSKTGNVSVFNFENSDSIEVDPFTAREIVNNFTREEVNKAAKRDLGLLDIYSTALTRDYAYWRKNPKSRL